MPFRKGKPRVNPYPTKIYYKRKASERDSSTSATQSTENISEIPREIDSSAVINPIISNMANPAVDISNNLALLKVPDAIKDLPKFDGNPRLLFEFINNVEEILSLLSDIDGTAHGRILLRAIRNKIEGPANEVLNMYGTPLEWASIKNNLILHYADKRNELSLIRDLHNCKQGSKPLENFYSEVIEISSAMNNHIQIHEKNASVIESKKLLYSEMCLNIFLTGLREPLGSTIRSMRPDTLAVAYSYCVKEQNITYFKAENHNFNRNNNNPTNKTNSHTTNRQAYSRPVPQNLNRNPNPQYQPRPQQYQSRPQQQNLPNPRFPVPNNQLTQQHRPTQPSNNFRPPQTHNNQTLPKPEPMELGSGHTNFRNQATPRPPLNIAPPYNNYQKGFYTVEELYNVSEQNSLQNPDENYNEQNHIPQQDQYYNPEQPEGNEAPFEIDDTNFQTIASQNPSVT